VPARAGAGDSPAFVVYGTACTLFEAPQEAALDRGEHLLPHPGGATVDRYDVRLLDAAAGPALGRHEPYSACQCAGSVQYCARRRCCLSCTWQGKQALACIVC